MSRTYGFQDVQFAIQGPGISQSLNGMGLSEEGITVSMNEDKNTMTMGVDGEGMHSLHAAKSATVTARFLKTSAANPLLDTAYNIQTMSTALHGTMVITVTNLVTGDQAVCTGVAFKKRPDLVNAKDGGIMEWAFDVINCDQRLGNGTFAQST